MRPLAGVPALASITLALALAMIGCCGRPAKAPAPRRLAQAEPYPVAYAPAPPKVDGRLDDAAWKQATPWTVFYRHQTYGHPVDIGAAYLAWDRENLYFAMSVEDKDVCADETDPAPCHYDTAELFLKPRDDRLDLYEFEFSPLGVVYYIHYAGRGGGTDKRYGRFSKADITTGAAVDGTLNNWEDADRGWAIEVAIPFKAFERAVPGGPKPGDLWKVNICGYDFSSYLERPLLFTSADGNMGPFDEYEVYPSVRFMPPAE